MHPTRLQIVEYLREHGSAGVQDLATATRLTPMTIRHHLAILEADGLVSSGKESGHVGRPRHVYSLTKNALSLFPERYDKLTDRLLKGLKELGVKPQIVQVLEKISHDIVGDCCEDFVGKSLEERLNILINVLGKEGFLASWEEQDGEYFLTEYSCPYLLVGQDHPEICRVDWQVITTILDAPVKRETCMLHGDPNCKFHIRSDFDVAIADIH